MFNLEKIKAFARPFTTYAGTVATVIGLFVPSVPADKLLIAAGLSGVMGVARSFDKRAAGQGGQQ